MKIRSIIENSTLHNPFGDDVIPVQSNVKQHQNDDFWQDDDPFEFIDIIDKDTKPSIVVQNISEYAQKLELLNNDDLAKQVSSMFVGDMIDYRDAFEKTYPFIYDQNTTEKFHAGEEGTYHESIYMRYNPPGMSYEDIQTIKQSLYNAYFKRNYGRIGVGLRHTKYDYNKILDEINENPSTYTMNDEILYDCIEILSKVYKRFSKTAFIGIGNMAQELLRPTVTAANQFIRRTLSIDSAYVIYNMQCVPYEEFTATQQQEASDSAKELGDLQVALHLGAWPNGKPLTAAEKKQIRTKLGLGPTVSNKKTWSGEFNKAGITKPGQKWWAMTSESKH